MWYVLINDDQLGPMSESDLRELITNGVVGSDALVWAESMTDWVPLGDSPFAPDSGGEREPQAEELEDDGTLVASPDDEALKAELAALFEQSQEPASIGERATAIDASQDPVDEDEPATIAMPSFVPGADLLDAISPPQADELSMTMGVAYDSRTSDRAKQADGNAAIDSESRNSAESIEGESQQDDGQGVEQNRPSDNLDYAEIDESLLRQARSTVVGHGPASDPEIALTQDPVVPEKPQASSEHSPENDVPQAKLVERETAVQDSRDQALSSPIAELEPAAPEAIQDARKIGRLEPGKKTKLPLVVGVVFVAILGVSAAVYFTKNEEAVAPPKPRPKAIKIGMSSKDIIKLTQAKKKSIDEAHSKSEPLANPNSKKGEDSEPEKKADAGQLAPPPVEPLPSAVKEISDLGKKTDGSIAGAKKTLKEQSPKKPAVVTEKKTQKKQKVRVAQRVKTDQLEKRKRKVATAKKAAQPKNQPAKSNLFGGNSAKGKLPFSLNHKQITRALGKRRGALKRCVGKDEKFKNAKVMIALTIKRDGRAANVRAISGSVRGTQIGRCIERAIAGVRFPRFSGDHMQLTVPIRL